MSAKKVYKVLLGEIEIDVKVCKGCGNCVDSCPIDVLMMRTYSTEKKPIVECPMECLLCKACESACELNALRVVMGE